METPQRELPRYRCHKEVWADKITAIIHDDGIAPPMGNHTTLCFDRGRVDVSKEYYEKHKPKVGGYYVVYKDGYESFSPADAFEDGYTLKDNRLANALHNDARKSLMFRRDRGLDGDNHTPYTVDDLLQMYRPYIEEGSHENLSPREVRLLEAVINALA